MEQIKRQGKNYLVLLLKSMEILFPLLLSGNLCLQDQELKNIHQHAPQPFLLGYCFLLCQQTLPIKVHGRYDANLIWVMAGGLEHRRHLTKVQGKALATWESQNLPFKGHASYSFCLRRLLQALCSQQNQDKFQTLYLQRLYLLIFQDKYCLKLNKTQNKLIQNKNHRLEFQIQYIFIQFQIKMGTCCQPTKAYLQANRRTGNGTTTRNVSDQKYYNQMLNKKSHNQRKGRQINASQQLNQINYNGILNDDQVYQLERKDIQEGPHNTDVQPSEFAYINMYVKPVSAVNQEVAYSLVDSRKGKKTYQTSYPKV